MADLAIVAADVEAGSGAVVESGKAGESMTGGQAVYLDSVTGRYKKAAAVATSTDDVAGVLLQAAVEDGQPMDFVSRGRLIINAVGVEGEVYVLSAAAAGGIAPVGDLIAGNFVTILGVGIGTGGIEINIQVSGVTK